jgi:bacterioferritin
LSPWEAFLATRNEIQQSRDLQEIFAFSLTFEAKAVEMYSKAIELAGGDKALVVFLEDILNEEQEGVDEYTKLLRNSGAAATANSTLKTA